VILLLSALLHLYTWVIILRAVLSWLNSDPRHSAVRLLHQATEPVLAPLRHLVRPQALGGLDLSPLLAIVLVQLIRYALLSIAYS
jgi:YggT family protein